MSALSNALVNRIIDAVLRARPLLMPSRYYVGLHTTQASASFAGLEVVGGGYSRVAITSSLDNWSGTQGPGTNTPSTGQSAGSTNNFPIIFPGATTDWGTVVGFGLYAAPTGGAPEIFGSVVTPTAIVAHAPSTTFAPGDLLIQMDA